MATPDRLWEFIAGHGVLELSEITFSGGAGLDARLCALASRACHPRDAGAAAQKSLRLLLGTAPLLVIAGLIEGIISPSDLIPVYVKIGIAIVSGILLYSYLLFVGRKPATP